MSEEPLLFTVEGGVARITLNRPAGGNTIDLSMAQALLQAALRCDHDDAIRVVVLTGNGRLFCAGGDVGSFAAAGEEVPAFLSELAGVLHMAVARLMRMDKPLLTLVNGAAAGAGMSLALAGDIVIAGKSASFTTAYGSIGLSPDGGMSWLLPRLVGMRRAQEMIIAGRRANAEEAESWGLVTRTVDDAELAAEGERQIAALLKASTPAVGAARALLLQSFDGPFDAQLERETRSIARMGGTRECRDAVAGFLAKRNAPKT